MEHFELLVHQAHRLQRLRRQTEVGTRVLEGIFCVNKIPRYRI